jgi:mono/diheme cytochrome c family protein
MNDQQNFDNTDLDRLHAAVKREKPDAQPGHEPAPLWVFVASMAAMILGGGYAGAFVGNGSFDQNSPFEVKPVDPRGIEISTGPALDPFQLAMKNGAQVFANCQGCHQITGTGQPGVFPPLAGSEWAMGGTERITRIVLAGLAGPVQVKGATFNNVMPPQAALSDKDLANVLTYIRNSWGNHGTMLTKDMVAKVRAEAASHTGPWSAADLDAFKDKNCPGEIPAGEGATVPPPGAAPAPGATPAPAAEPAKK